MGWGEPRSKITCGEKSPPVGMPGAVSRHVPCDIDHEQDDPESELIWHGAPGPRLRWCTERAKS